MTRVKNNYDKRYLNGLIYYIYCKSTDSIYVGSTCVSLNKRMRDHDYDFRAYMGMCTNTQPRSYRTSADVLCNYNYFYGILEKYPCDNKYELEVREGLWIKAYKQNPRINVVNRAKPAGELNTIVPYYYYSLPQEVLNYQASFLHTPSVPSEQSVPSDVHPSPSLP